MSERNSNVSIVLSQSASLTKARAQSLVARGRADLRAIEDAGEWLKRGLELRKHGNHEEAFACFERGIQLNPNHSEIQFILGYLFANGEGTTRDLTRGRMWYRKAAEQGMMDAQYNLGLLYYGWDDGPGLLENYKQAADWFRRAAAQGSEKAKSRLILLYSLGYEVPQDDEWEVDWGRRAAEQGDIAAQRTLGDRYRDGRGLPQDNAEAATWYRKAAQNGDLAAQISLAEMYSHGSVPRELCVHFSFEENCDDAVSPLALALDEETYLKHGCKEAAAYWYGRAAQQGSEIAASALAELQPLLILERAKWTIFWSGTHINFEHAEDRKKHYAEIQDAVRVLTDAGYKVKSAGFGYELESVQ